MDGLFTKGLNGLLPADDATRTWFTRLKLGATVHSEAREMRNGQFFKKWWKLVELGYDHWSEAAPTIEFRGQPVLPNFERFRKDVTIMAGFYYAVANLKGEVRIEAESLKWSSMTEERFTKLYDATIQVLLRMVFNGKICRQWSEEELRRVSDQIMEFAA